ncbi:MAG: EF-hand domain-containing protein [Spirochaetales bacterium]|nr:EF-hand domain-containing protein [Spirochaetales bacterium]
MGGRGAMTPEMMTQYDKDGNGELSVEERTAMREAMRAGGMRPAGATQ